MVNIVAHTLNTDLHLRMNINPNYAIKLVKQLHEVVKNKNKHSNNVDINFSLVKL